MHDTTEELHALLQRLVRLGGFVEPHEHAGVLVTASEVMALFELGDGPLSQQELGARLGLEKSTVSRLAAGLEQRGWLTRERRQRFYELRMTPDGRDIAARIHAEILAHHDALFSRLTTDERAALGIGLRALHRAVAEIHADCAPDQHAGHPPA